jgi:group I intron endonuclease
MNGGIYTIVNNRYQQAVYVGSTNDFDNRKYQHWSDLRRNCHKNKHLQNSWNRHGADSFSFKIIEFASDDNLEIREQFWIDYYKRIGTVYNIGVCAKNAFRGTKRPPETIEKMRLACAGRKPSKEAYLLGTKVAAEKSRGKAKSPETLAKISSAYTDERKKEQSERMKKYWAERRAARLSNGSD